MSDSKHSTITYTLIFNDYEEPSDVGSPGVVVYVYDGLPMHPTSPDYVPRLEHPPSLDYVSGPEHPPLPVYVPYLLEPAYLKFMPPEDDVFPAEEQPLSATVSPTANSPGYITESDPEENPKEEDESPEEDPADYPADYEDDDEEEESFGDDANDEEEDEGEDEEEEDEKHLAPADSVDRLLDIPTLPPSPLNSLYSSLPWIPSPPFFIPSPPTTSPTYTEAPLGYRAAGIRLRTSSPSPLPLSSPLPLPPPIILPRTKASMVMMRAAAPSTYCLTPLSRTPPSGIPPLLHTPLPESSPPLLLPSTNCRANVPKVTLPPQKRLCIALGPRYEIGECSSAPTARPTRGFRADYSFVGTLDADIRRDPDMELGYGITNVWVDPDEIAEEIPVTDVTKLGQRMTDFITTVRQVTDEIYVRLNNARDDRLLMSGQLNLLREIGAPMLVRLDLWRVRPELLVRLGYSLWMPAVDHKRQAQLVEALTLMRTLQTQTVALQSQQRPVGDPTHPDVIEEADSSS
ncbi:hypothetical protein Tco_0751567 [Tanacetum coccineum]|uniref:Uncharacterized protein n=1 Tax=Tanacetum coccineum TaxID=301880 RepID=A0ABQ4Z5J9_9ASTR